MDGGKTERIMLSHPSGVDGSLEATTEYRDMGPTINGCSWVELRSITGGKHQVLQGIFFSAIGNDLESIVPLLLKKTWKS